MTDTTPGELPQVQDRTIPEVMKLNFIDRVLPSVLNSMSLSEMINMPYPPYSDDAKNIAEAVFDIVDALYKERTRSIKGERR